TRGAGRARRREVLAGAGRAGHGGVRRPARRRRARRDQADGREELSVATEVILPRLGQGMESGTIVRWLKSEGEPVQKGEPLFELDTDKVTQEVEAEAAGVLLKIAVAEGEVPVGQTVAFIGAEGEDVPEVERVPLSNVRKTIARRLTEAWQIPVFQLQASAEMTRVNALVARLRKRDPDVRVTVTDVLTKVCAQALMRHREVNAEFTEDAIL